MRTGGAGASVKLVAPHLGMLTPAAGAPVPVDFSFHTTASVLFDAVIVPGGERSVAALVNERSPREVIKDDGTVWEARFAVSMRLAASLPPIGAVWSSPLTSTIAAGATPKLTLNPLESVQTMTAYMVQVSMGEVVFGSVEYQTIFAVGLTLFAITLLMNIVSIAVLRRFREVYE